MLDEFPWSICMRKWKWFSNQTFSRWVCLKTGRREYSFTLGYDKIILHRIISVVWLTNFLSEIQSLSNHDDETKFRILSVKPSRKFSFSEHWWSLIALYCAVMDVKQSEWPLHISGSNFDEIDNFDDSDNLDDSLQLWWLWQICKVANAKRNQNRKKKKKKKIITNSTQCSQAVSHPSTN